MRRVIVALALAALAVASDAAAQENFHRVYEWETPMRAWLEPSLWTTYVGSSDLTQDRFGETQARDGLWAHSLEIEYGLTDAIAVGGYLDLEDAPGAPLRYTRTRAVFRWSLFSKYTHWMDPALYVEYYLPRGGTGDPEELETRLILEKDFNQFRLDLNPTFSKVLSGEDVGEGLEFGLSAGLYYRRHYLLQPGIEYFNQIGPLRSPLEAGSQQHYLAPMVRVQWGRGWRWEVRALIGLTSGSDDGVVQSLFSYEFPTIRPSRQTY